MNESTGLDALAEAAETTVSPGLTTAFGQRGIANEGELRAAGGPARALAGDPLAHSEPALKLEAHVALGGLPAEPAERLALLQAGFRNAFEVAEADPEALSATLPEGHDVFALQGAAQARIAEARTTVAAAAAESVAESCPDCASALSPAAYLADLIAFCQGRFATAYPSIPTFLAMLETRFHQPFADLPLTCRAVTEELPQVRIAVEVLRAHLAIHPPSTPPAAGEAAYRLLAYEALLAEAGTSFDEIRLSRTASPEARVRTADRLGVAAGDLAELAVDPAALTEDGIETLFGLRSTLGDPLSQGAKMGDASKQVVRWRFDSARWGVSTEQDGRIALRLTATEAGGIRVEALRQGEVIALGVRDTPSGDVKLDAQGPGGISGVVRLDYQSDTDQIWIELVSRLESMRQRRLRARWAEEDRPVDVYEVDRPIIDPTVIGAADLRVRHAGDPVYDRLIQRQNWLTAAIVAIRTAREQSGLPATIAAIWGTTAAELDQWRDHLAAGVDVEAIRATLLARLHVGIEAFLRVVEIRDGGNVDAGDVDAILAGSQAWGQRAAWLADEAAAGIELEPGRFRRGAAVAKPALTWSLDAEARVRWQDTLRVHSTLPVVDPDRVDESEFRRLGGAAAALFRARRDWITTEAAALKALREEKPTQIAGIDAILTTVLKITTSEFSDLLFRQAAGDNVGEALDDLALTDGTLARLGGLRSLAQTSSLLSGEWEEAEAILTGVSKRRRLYAWWKEEAQTVVLGPDDFVDPAVEPELAAWRSSEAERNAWRRLLRARRDQTDAIHEAVTEAAKTVEGRHLEVLRDVLIGAAPRLVAGDDPEWITRMLLIDPFKRGVHTTTRVSQAIETLQALIRGAQSGDLATPYPDLKLDANGFDATWEWIGTYAMWRAAMFVFLYPENLLLPTLDRRQTPEFSCLAGDQRLKGGFTPRDAMRGAQEFQDYVLEVGRLEVQATVCADVRQSDGKDTPALFLFARPYGNAEAVYWSMEALGDGTGKSQTGWEKVPGLSNASSIVGAALYRAPERRYVLLYCTKDPNLRLAYDKPLLVLCRFDLDLQQWEGEPQEFTLPDPVGATSSVWQVDRILLERGGGPYNPPFVYVHFGLTLDPAQRRYALHIKVERLRPDLNDWDGGWQDIEIGTQSPTPDLLAVAVIRPGYQFEPPLKLLVFQDYNPASSAAPSTVRCALHKISTGEVREVFSRSSLIRTRFDVHVQLEYGYSMPPSFDLDPRRNVYVHLRDGQGKSVSFRLMAQNNPNPLSVEAVTDYTAPTVLGGAPHFGGFAVSHFPNPQAPARAVFDSLPGNGPFSPPFAFGALFDYGPPSSTLSLVRKHMIVPNWSGGQFNIPSSVADVNFDARRRAARDLHLLNLRYGVSESSPQLQYLREAYFSLPIQTGFRLMQRGFYPEALGWFRTVYNYLGPAGHRKVDYGLVLEEARDPEQAHPPEGFFNDPFDPHLVAQSRRNSYTRFVLWLMARCLIEYADDEFTRDSAESVPHARELYLQALDILDTPPDLPSQPIPEPEGGGGGPIDTGVGTIVALDFPPALSKPTHSTSSLTMGAVLEVRRDLVVRSLAMGGEPRPGIPAISAIVPFCVPPNAFVQSHRFRAVGNLAKLRTGRNIAGMERQLAPYAAPIDSTTGAPSIGANGTISRSSVGLLRPTSYRYATLIGRARELVQLASQIESAMLSSIERADAERYTLMKAKQDVSLARAGVQLQDLRVRQAEDGVGLAQLQQERAQLQVDHYKSLLDEGLSGLEEASLALQLSAAALFVSASAASAIPNIIAGLANGIEINWGGIVSNLASAAQMQATILSSLASYERRAEDWEFQQSLGQQDVRIGQQGVKIADDAVKVAGQERTIAQAQVDHADATVDFLTNKFTNVELYDWMSDVLERVYRYFLQQATSMAQLASSQLAFERQEIPPQYIRTDYWESMSEDALPGQNSGTTDRRGLTGSARLLQDVVQLDQYAFETDRRKLQLSKTISLARLAPIEFQRFRETGRLLFSTPMELFDRDFPGHYLRLIKRVKTSVVALIPPTQGIRAMLWTTGVSRTVIGGDVFSTVVVARPPEVVALSSPRDATGVFDLTPQNEMLLPFEGLGVDSSWELQMPKAANLFDYSTVADVLFTLEYTALNSADYRQQVLKTLGRELVSDRPFSFRHTFADVWYALHNAGPGETRFVFRTRREDFPPNLEELSIEQVALYFSFGDGNPIEMKIARLRFFEGGGVGGVGGGAQSVDGVVSTRRGNGGSWTPILGKSVVGTWELTLSDGATLRAFAEGRVADVLLSITYRATAPPWPE